LNFPTVVEMLIAAGFEGYAIDRRMQIEPAAETERSQKIIMVAAPLIFGGVPALLATGPPMSPHYGF
jgi:hypothetical protein